jgi:hypothetical protein
MRTWSLVLSVFGMVVATQGCGSQAGPGDAERVASVSSAVCSSTTLSSNVSGNTAPAGTPVTWTATPSCDGGDIPTYEFYELAPGGSWTIAQPYGTSSTFAWDTSGAAAGTYAFQVWVRAQGSTAPYESYAIGSFTITADNGLACTSATVSASPASPQPTGTSITLTGGSSTCGAPEYEFYELAPGGSWTIAQAYSSSPTFAFSNSTAGTYQFQVWARDASSNAAFDTYAVASYTLTGGSSTCTGATLSGAPASPQLVGTSVMLTGSSSSCNNPQYEFYELAPGGSWTIAQAYSSSPTFAFEGGAAGTYQFQVWVRDASSNAAYDTYAPLTYTLDTACTSATFSASPTSPQPTGTSVTLTGGSSSCGTPEYEFYELAPGGSWQIVQAYSSSPTFAFSSGTAGDYAFQIWVRDAASGAVYDTYALGSYTLQ